MSNVTTMPSMIVAFAVTVAFMFALRPLAQRIHLVDRPGGRKLHDGDIPIVGGVAMFIGIFSGLALVSGPTYLIGTLLLGSLLLVVIGLIDDKYALAASVRMTIQIAAVLIMYFGSGFRLADIGDPFGTGVIVMGPFTLIFTTVVSLTVINAYNLIDGADGLAGSLSLIALLAISVVSGVGNPTTAIALTVSAAIIGFLVFNYPVRWNRHVRSFMGDAGSTLLGFSILWITLGASQGSDRLVSPVVALWFASIPIYDLLTCFVKRAIARKSPFLPGRDHFHHVLNRGSTQVRRTLLVLSGLQAVYAGVGVAGHFAGVPDWLMFAGWSVLGLSQFLIVRKLAAFMRWFRLRTQSARRKSAAAS